jgi:hypothetical protein
LPKGSKINWSSRRKPALEYRTEAPASFLFVLILLYYLYPTPVTPSYAESDSASEG